MREPRGSDHLLKWITDQGIETALIDPGKPWQNGTTESFNGKFRDECLSLEWFRSRAEAKVIIETWRRHFNEVRPHSSLGYMTPTEFVASITTNAGPVTATERTAAVCGASALRSVAQPLRKGQTQKAELAAYANSRGSEETRQVMTMNSEEPFHAGRSQA